MGDLGHLLLDVAVILDVDAALGDQGGNGFGVFGISLGHGQADIGPFHSTSLLLSSSFRQRRREKFCHLYSTRFCARMQAPPAKPAALPPEKVHRLTFGRTSGMLY